MTEDEFAKAIERGFRLGERMWAEIEPIIASLPAPLICTYPDHQHDDF